MTRQFLYGTGGGAPLFTTTEAVISTAEATQNAAYTDLSTVGPSVTITVPTSGKVIITLGALIQLAGVNGNNSSMGFALSGANTVSATDTQRLWFNGSNNSVNCGFQGSTSFLLTGLTAGSTTFTAKYHADGSNSTTFSARRLCVEPVDADVSSGGSAAFASNEVVIATSESTTSATWTDLTTPGPAVTVTVPASGKVKVTVTGQLQCNAAESGMGFALTGANTLAASANNRYVGYQQANATSGFGNSFSSVMTGLTAGSTTFTAKYISNGVATATFANRRLRVEPVDADKG